MLCKEIARAGGTSIGPVTSVADALKKIEFQIVDAVILDAKLVDARAQTWPAVSRNVEYLCGDQRLRRGRPADATARRPTSPNPYRCRF
jgi:hypothetical protein